DYEMTLVQQHPAIFRFEFATGGFQFELFTQVIFDLFDDRLYLSLAWCRGKEECVGNTEAFRYVYCRDILGLHGCCGFRRDLQSIECGFVYDHGTPLVHRVNRIRAMMSAITPIANTA